MSKDTDKRASKKADRKRKEKPVRKSIRRTWQELPDGNVVYWDKDPYLDKRPTTKAENLKFVKDMLVDNAKYVGGQVWDRTLGETPAEKSRRERKEKEEYAKNFVHTSSSTQPSQKTLIDPNDPIKEYKRGHVYPKYYGENPPSSKGYRKKKDAADRDYKNFVDDRKEIRDTFEKSKKAERKRKEKPVRERISGKRTKLPNGAYYTFKKDPYLDKKPTTLSDRMDFLGRAALDNADYIGGQLWDHTLGETPAEKSRRERKEKEDYAQFVHTSSSTQPKQKILIDPNDPIKEYKRGHLYPRYYGPNPPSSKQFRKKKKEEEENKAKAPVGVKEAAPVEPVMPVPGASIYGTAPSRTLGIPMYGTNTPSIEENIANMLLSENVDGFSGATKKVPEAEKKKEEKTKTAEVAPPEIPPNFSEMFTPGKSLSSVLSGGKAPTTPSASEEPINTPLASTSNSTPPQAGVGSKKEPEIPMYLAGPMGKAVERKEQVAQPIEYRGTGSMYSTPKREPVGYSMFGANVPSTVDPKTNELIEEPVDGFSGATKKATEREPYYIEKVFDAGKEFLDTAPYTFLPRLAHESYTDFKGALGRTIEDTDLSANAKLVGKAAAPIVNSAIRTGAEWLGVDVTTPLMDEVIEGDKVKKDLAEGQEAHQKAQQETLSKELLGMKGQGVTKEDALSTLESKRQEMTPEEYNNLLQKITAQYTTTGTGPVTNPELENVKLRQENRTSGKGDGDGYVKPTVKSTSGSEAMIETANEVGKKAAFSFNTPPVWWESDSFSTSLITFGMSLLSGNDYGTAFKEASEMFDNKYAKEKRQAYAQELYADGYSKQQIMEWIDTGKSSVLSRQETYSTDSDEHGYFQINNLTGKKEYLESKSDREYNAARLALTRAQTAKALQGSGSKKGPFDSNLQYQIAKNMMPVSDAIWAAAWGNDQNNYPMMETGGKWSDVLGKDNFVGSLTHNFLLEQQKKARESEEAFMQSYGRPLSGGAITEAEWRSWGGYLFPRPGDKNDPLALLRKQLIRDTVSYTIVNLENQGIVTPENKQKMFENGIIAARHVAENLKSYNMKTGWYELKDGSYYHPQTGVVK